MNLEAIEYMWADDYNYKRTGRKLTDIKYIVIHYTANINDTPKNNCTYFAREKVECSAHYFVRDRDIMQSVPLTHAAFAVGDKSNINKASMHGLITNANSVSIECCGSIETTDASAQTRRTAAELAATLCIYLKLKPDRVFRHYDVSGKICPKWAVVEPKEWFDFLSLVYGYYEQLKGGHSVSYTQEEWMKFLSMMSDYLQLREEQEPNYGDAEAKLCADEKIINDGRPNAWATRREMQVVAARLMKKFKT